MELGFALLAGSLAAVPFVLHHLVSRSGRKSGKEFIEASASENEVNSSSMTGSDKIQKIQRHHAQFSRK